MNYKQTEMVKEGKYGATGVISDAEPSSHTEQSHLLTLDSKGR